MKLKAFITVLLAALMLCSLFTGGCSAPGHEITEDEAVIPENAAYIIAANNVLERIMTNSYDLTKFGGTVLMYWYRFADNAPSEKVLDFAISQHNLRESDENAYAAIGQAYSAMQSAYEDFSALEQEDADAAQFVSNEYEQYCELYAALTTPSDISYNEYASKIHYVYQVRTDIRDHLLSSVMIDKANLSEQAKDVVTRAIEKADEYIDSIAGSTKTLLMTNHTFEKLRDELNYVYELDTDAENYIADSSARTLLAMLNVDVLDNYTGDTTYVMSSTGTGSVFKKLSSENADDTSETFENIIQTRNLLAKLADVEAR